MQGQGAEGVLKQRGVQEEVLVVQGLRAAGKGQPHGAYVASAGQGVERVLEQGRVRGAGVHGRLPHERSVQGDCLLDQVAPPP